jgi:hypothetical protein
MVGFVERILSMFTFFVTVRAFVTNWMDARSMDAATSGNNINISVGSPVEMDRLSIMSLDDESGEQGTKNLLDRTLQYHQDKSEIDKGPGPSGKKYIPGNSIKVLDAFANEDLEPLFDLCTKTIPLDFSFDKSLSGTNSLVQNPGNVHTGTSIADHVNPGPSRGIPPPENGETKNREPLPVQRVSLLVICIYCHSGIF